MIKKTKIASYSVHKMNVMDVAKRVLRGRGLDFISDEKVKQIVIPTQQGKVVYYPLRGEYNHGMIRGYAENPDSMIAYIVKCGVVHSPSTEQVAVRKYYTDENIQQLTINNPVSILETISFKITDTPLDIDHKISLVKSYGQAIHRCSELMATFKKGSKEYAEVQAYMIAVSKPLAALKSKYPFLKRGGEYFSSLIIECLKEDVSETVWLSYVERAHQKMIDKYFGVKR